MSLQKGSKEIRGQSYHFREWTMAERAYCLRRRQEDPFYFYAAVVFQCAIKPDGSRLYATENEAAELPPSIGDVIASEVLKLSGVRPDDEGDEKNA